MTAQSDLLFALPPEPTATVARDKAIDRVERANRSWVQSPPGSSANFRRVGRNSPRTTFSRFWGVSALRVTLGP